ncbi:MAG: hypothetical protein EZS28_004921 [Streblomastix strix]|uniref:Uncharacterized protein n=1 Tax=Streblomastix strix TaxID=222440 RepID=A0A5J4WYY1_9EUKA|nr:MAG: hypothetical protein EZS28_004921 [Streblomastix strix]
MFKQKKQFSFDIQINGNKTIHTLADEIQKRNRCKAVIRCRPVEKGFIEALYDIRNDLLANGQSLPTDKLWHCEIFIEDGSNEHYGFFPTSNWGLITSVDGVVKPDDDEHLSEYSLDPIYKIDAAFAKKCIYEDIAKVERGEFKDYEYGVFDCRFYALDIINRYRESIGKRPIGPKQTKRFPLGAILLGAKAIHNAFSDDIHSGPSFVGNVSFPLSVSATPQFQDIFSIGQSGEFYYSEDEDDDEEEDE